MSNLGDDNMETLAKKWAEELKQKKDWRALAAYRCAYYDHPTEEDLSYDDSVDLWNHKGDQVMEILREAGAEAVDDIILALEQGEDKDLEIALLLKDIGGTKAVPIIKKLYEKGNWNDTVSIYQFLQEVDPETRQEAEELLRDQEQRRINAQKEVAAYTETEMITLLQQLCEAWAENRPKTSTIEMEAKALAIGERLSSKGGIDEMKRIFFKANGTRALDGFWHGIGGWMG